LAFHAGFSEELRARKKEIGKRKKQTPKFQAQHSRLPELTAKVEIK